MSMRSHLSLGVVTLLLSLSLFVVTVYGSSCISDLSLAEVNDNANTNVSSFN